MFKLLVIACLSGVCHYETSPLAYVSEERCTAQAAIVAGMAKAHHRPGTPMKYRYVCKVEQPSETAKLIVDGEDPAPGRTR